MNINELLADLDTKNPALARLLRIPDDGLRPMDAVAMFCCGAHAMTRYLIKTYETTPEQIYRLSECGAELRELLVAKNLSRCEALIILAGQVIFMGADILNDALIAGTKDPTKEGGQ